MTDSFIFTAGGTVQAGGGLYLSRPADGELLQHCLDADFSYVLTARQMGKSSLMVRTAETLRTRGLAIVIIDLTRLGTTLEQDQWYLGLVDELVEQLDLTVDYKNWWQNHSHLSPTQRLSRFLREVVLEAVSAPLVIFIDEIDTTLSLPFADDFFVAIRACYNARSTDIAYKRLSFVLLGAATPDDLIRDPLRTPFNIGTRIDLTDFTLEQALPLADGFNLPPEAARKTLQWVLHWTGGHPYLTQRLCRALFESPRTDWDEAVVAKIVEETFFGERGKQDSNLQFVLDMLTRRAPAGYQTAMLRTLQTLQHGGKVKDEEQAIAKMYLKLSGIVRREGEHLVLRNKIYAKIFDQRWLSKNWPVSVRRRQATISAVFVLIGLVVSLIFLLFLVDLQQPPDIISITCTLRIQIYTQRGTHANPKYNVVGSVVLDDVNSKFDRNLESSHDPITLYFDETVIHFVITTQYGRIFGDGVLEKNLKTCAGKASGKQSGPALDDQGIWLGKLKRDVMIIHPPSIESKLLKWVWIGLGGLPTMFLVGWLMGKLYAKEE